MRIKPKTHRPAPRLRPAPVGDFEWEELPSLIHRVVLPIDYALRAEAAPWPATEPMEMTPLAPAELAAEAMPGLVAREVTEPEIHRLFFGKDLLVNPLAQREAARRRLGMLPLDPEEDVLL